MQPSNIHDHKLPPVDQALQVSATQSGPSFVSPQPMSAGASLGPQQLQPSPVNSQMTPQQQMAANMAMMGGLQADDVDLIEKAWVEKAKAIVQGTHGNPYLQSQELGKIKAEYIKKRYNKDIKVAE